MTFNIYALLITISIIICLLIWSYFIIINRKVAIISFIALCLFVISGISFALYADIYLIFFFK